MTPCLDADVTFRPTSHTNAKLFGTPCFGGCGLVSIARAATLPDLPRRARHSRDEEITTKNEHHAYVIKPLRIRVDVDDTELFQKGVFCGLVERTRSSYELLKVDMGKVHLELSATEGGKEGKSKFEVSNP